MLSMDETNEVAEVIAQAIVSAEQFRTRSAVALTIIAQLEEAGWVIEPLDLGPSGPIRTEPIAHDVETEAIILGLNPRPKTMTLDEYMADHHGEPPPKFRLTGDEL